MAKLLLVEDDAEVREKVRAWLAFEKYTVDSVTSGDEAVDMLRVYQYEAVILDWNLPGTSGVEVLRKMRLNQNRTPVLMLTGKKEIEDKEEGLDSGADDYLTKPFHLKELSARIRAILRRPQTYTGNVLKAGCLEMNIDTREVRKNGQVVQLLPLEASLLELFMRHPGQLFSHDSLLDRVWSSESQASIDALRTYIKTLRRKIDGDADQSFIRTVHGIGYKFEA